MKRKDWKIRNLKKDIFGKKYKKIRRIRERFLFLRKLFIRQNKYLVKKNSFVNYIFYKQLLNLYKIKKHKYYFNLLFKTKIEKLSFFPEFAFTKNVFNKKIKFKKLKSDFKIKLIFLPINFNKINFGLNYYIFSGDINNFIKQLNDENYNNLMHLKNNNFFLFNHCFNYHFNFNLNNLCLLEVYKIIILININFIKN